MLDFYVSNQTMRMYTPVIAADTLHFLTGKVHFTDDVWDGFTKTIHFTDGNGLGATVYDIVLSDDAFAENAELNLTVGEWEVYLTGAKDESRLTTTPVILTVKESGLIDAPLHVMPLSVAEQIGTQAATALAFAAAVKAAALAGDFNGADGRSFVIEGIFDTAEDLEEAVPNPEVGAAYGVGTEAPYDIYIWDSVHSEWVNNGQLQGAKGNTGDTGTTFTPIVDANGNISWTNDGGKTNPTSRNIKGPAGATGPAGTDGKSPYQVAVENGYTGTEATFNMALALVAAHAVRHQPTGADPISVYTDNLVDGAVTRAKIGSNAVSSSYNATITTTWTGTSSTDSQYLSPNGTDTAFTIDAAPDSITQVKVLATGTILTPTTDYTYSSGTLTFTSAPASGTNAIEVKYPVTIPPYTQTVSVPGIKSTDKIFVDVSASATVSEAVAQLDAFASVYKITAADDALTVYSFDVTTTAVPIIVLAVSK